MSYITMTGIAVALAMDAFAVSISYGCSPVKMHLKNAFIISFFFGAFQAFMPVIGWFSGKAFALLIKEYDHWIAFTLLLIIGLRMIIEGFKERGPEELCEQNIDLGYKKLLVLSVATSIDALAVGLSLSLIGSPIALPAVIIGTVTFSMSFVGIRAGLKLRHVLGRKSEILGGIILIFIGSRILFEHLS